MKKSSFLALAFCLLPLAANAEPRTLVKVSDESLSRIEKLHKQAEDQIVQNDFRGALSTYEDILLIEPDDEVAYTNLGRIYLILGDTQKAERSFENALHINPENEAALVGIQKIRDPDAPAAETPPSSKPGPAALSPPSFGKRVQQALKNAGLYTGEIDGKIGPASRAAIIRFQKFHGLEPDGAVGPKTWSALEPYLAVPADDLDR